ncbi:MAG: hypothetical protein AMXMBFR64_18040 [Myxococcales bacterium]
MVTEPMAPAREAPVTALALVRFVRVRDWVHFLPLPLLSVGDGPPLATFSAALVAAAGCLAFAYGVNEWEDEGGARGGRSTPWGASAAVLKGTLGVSAAGALTAAALNGLGPALAALGSLAGGLLYSAGPRLKRRPVIGTLANGWIFAPLALLGGAQLTRDGALLLAGFVAVLLQNQLVHEAAHGVADRADGIRTTWLRFGPRVVSALVALLGAGAIIALLAAAPTLAVALAAAPLAAVTLAAGPAALAMRAAVLRRWQRLAGLVAGAVAWLACAPSV